jgi:hypothetical protein
MRKTIKTTDIGKRFKDSTFEIIILRQSGLPNVGKFTVSFRVNLADIMPKNAATPVISSFFWPF